MRFLEELLFGLAVVILVSQVLLPMVFNRPLFPTLRKSRKGLNAARAEVSEAEEALEAARLHERAEILRKKTKELLGDKPVDKP